MPCTYISCVAERHMGRESTGTLIQAKLPEEGEALLSRFGGQVQTIYLDPPFNTGKQFDMKARIGEKGYRTGSPSLSLPAYDDRWPDRAEYLSMMKQTLLLSRELLKKEGTLFLHIETDILLRFLFSRNIRHRHISGKSILRKHLRYS